ncbi:MAG: carboxypeptidase-like regulatory domain-containing protein [Bacteroidetes bacterium]|nr:carboxypeptidase-like regulatory domain-containing protein [Bacteroidota bacterium]
MLRKIYLLTAAFLVATGFAAFAQTGSIKGKVLDKTTKEPLPFANVIVEMNGSQAGGAQTDFDGNFTIKPLQPGKYNLKASFVGYTAAEVTGVLVSADKITFQDISLPKGAVDITAVEVTSYKNPIIDKGNPSSQTTVTQEEIQVAPTRDVKSVASTTAGVFQKDEGDDINVRGSRSDATDYYVDGIKVRGSTALPQSGIEQITVVTGGVPAQYGDATGGIINITTRGPSKEFFGGVEFVTSELFDKYGYNLAGLNISGPVWSKKDAEGKVDRTIVGFFLSAEYQIEKDPDPSAIGMYKVKDEIFDGIKQNPLSPTLNGGSVFRNKTEFLRADAFEKIKIKQNTGSTGYRVSGKIDIQPVDNITLTFGSSYDHNDRNEFIYTYSLYNYDNNNQKIDDSWRVFGRLTQKLGGSKSNSEGAASVIKNAFYSIQVDYNKTKTVYQDENHEDRYFDYGYIGKFNTVKNKNLFLNQVFSIDPNTGDTTFTIFDDNGNGILYEQAALPGDSVVLYNGGDVNPLTQAYTDQYFQLAGDDYQQYYSTLSQVAVNGGIVNGALPRNTYSLYRSPGYTFNQYRVVESAQFRVSASVSADVKDHAIVAGFEYDQRTDQEFIINPVGLWGLARLRANENNQQLDRTSPTYVGNTVYYPRAYSNIDGLDGFYENLRAKLNASGYNLGISDFVDLDNLDRSLLSLDLFTAEELLNSGNPLVNYYGYNYKGEKQSGTPSFDDFWTAKDESGNFTRPIGAFEPIYMAGYIQDKFAINDLIFNVGLRIDRFDANQKVLKDRYLLYPAYTAGQKAPNRPSNIGDDFIVYVDDVDDPVNANIIGYRDEDTWYDANGILVSNPALLAQQSATGKIAPWLLDTELASNGVQQAKFKPSDSFKDYEPSVSVMPRVAFSFPISDEALFFAHYDVLTQRPPSRSRSHPIDYYYIESQGALLNNPALKPERTTDYEIGFKETLSKSSAFTVSAFYRELRDMIQQTSVNFAFPKSYLSFDNIDFGTVKGLNFGYDMRRTGNVRLSANYSLQFADGTGSGDRTSDKLLQNGYPNLRTIAPLDFDQRHAITVSMDYRYESGKDYNGPMIKNTQVLANTGMNVVLRAGSGTPYSRQRDIITEANNLGLQQVGSGLLDGEINGSRLPWQYRIDLKVDRDFELKFGKSEGSKPVFLNVYIQVQNLFDTRNVVSVYRYTGNPGDDGYLASAVGQSQIPLQTDPTAFVDQYNIKVNNPSNYSLPRRARIGIKLDF